MRKIISFLLSILLVFSLCCCTTTKNPEPNLPENLPTDNLITKEDQGPLDNEEPENNDDGISGSQTQVTQPPNLEPITPNTPPQEQTPPPTINEIVTTHTALKKEQYYQYSFLNENEKMIYNEFYAAAEKFQNIVELTKYKASKSTVKKVYDAFIADCPQYFYVSKYFTYVITTPKNHTEEIVTEFILQYTDGSVTDSFDNQNSPITLADRQKINAQIIEFANKINAILSHIPSNLSELQRERIIYRYIADTVTYDNQTEDTLKVDPDFTSFSFSAYGAACKGTAVCEGYVKLFQYLCYNSGINVTPVESDEEMRHMWAAAKIDNKWYMTDITWDDSDDILVCTYKYFNVTTLFISDNHSFGSKLKIPVCNSDDAAFYNNFAIIPNGDALPYNYKTIIDNVVQNGDAFIYIYRTSDYLDLLEYININIYRGECKPYLESLGFELGDEYYHHQNHIYYFIPIIKK